MAESTARPDDSTIQGQSVPGVRWSTKPHRRRLLLIRGTATLVFFAFAIPGVVIGMSYTPAYGLVVVGLVPRPESESRVS